jgi:hypothetical protein
LQRAIYYDVIDLTTVEGVVKAILAALPELNDVQFLLAHAKELLPANPRDILGSRLAGDLRVRWNYQVG